MFRKTLQPLPSSERWKKVDARMWLWKWELKKGCGRSGMCVPHRPALVMVDQKRWYVWLLNSNPKGNGRFGRCSGGLHNIPQDTLSNSSKNNIITRNSCSLAFCFVSIFSRFMKITKWYNTWGKSEWKHPLKVEGQPECSRSIFVLCPWNKIEKVSFTGTTWTLYKWGW